MSSKFALGSRALGTCDMCAQVYLLRDLKPEIYNQRPTGFLVCSECLDVDQEQLQVGKWPINDPQALRNPRVDTNLLSSRALWGWAPVGNGSTNASAQNGVVSVNGAMYYPVRQVTP